jgi:prolyl-tRNA editing enzyme YbaK/EbsC (Cys-tRNA(Pro) deacylase)
MHPNARRVQEALRAAGADTDVVELAGAATTAALAAESLGVSVGQIANSLVFVADGSPVLVLTSGAHRVDTSKVAAFLGAATVQRADPDTVRAATGFPIGGVSPVGHATELPVLIDQDLEQYDAIWAAGGTPHTVFRTTYAELTRLSRARPADVRRDQYSP